MKEFGERGRNMLMEIWWEMKEFGDGEFKKKDGQPAAIFDIQGGPFYNPIYMNKWNLHKKDKLHKPLYSNLII